MLWFWPSLAGVMKYLLWIALIVIVMMILRKAQGARSRRQTPPPPAERMVSCAVCQLNQPLSESLFLDGRYYCCAAHRRLAQEQND